MEEQKYQKELFKFEEPKKSFPRFAHIFPKPDLDKLGIVITLTLDKVVFLTIGMIMLMVIIYALGVEIGKSKVREMVLMRPPIQSLNMDIHQAEPIKPPKVLVQGRAFTQQQQSRSASSALRAATFPSIAVTTPREMVAPYQGKTAGKSFVIVTGAYRNKDNALQEVAGLRRGGFEAFVSQTDNYFKVCIGPFTSRDNAQRVLPVVRKMRSGAYVQ